MLFAIHFLAAYVPSPLQAEHLLTPERMHGAQTSRLCSRLTMAASVSAASCNVLLRELFGDGTPAAVDASAVASACSDTVEWVDMGLEQPLRGRAAVAAHLRELYPAGSLLAVERLSDGTSSGGFTWHREAEGVAGIGLRGITYCELDADGKISFVQEGYEPLFKLDKALDVIAKLLAGADKGEEKAAPTFEEATPRDAEGIVKYLWQVAYPGGAEPAEALRFFGKDCVYEDFNYQEPFCGIDAITEYINLLPDIPNFVFVPGRISQGAKGCCFTWKVVVNGSDGPSGISFKEVDADGKITFNRDIPAPTWPRPVGRVAAALRPKLRVFSPRE